MNIIDKVMTVFCYGLMWLVVGSAVAFVLAAAFFGYPKEKSEENQHDL
jgi:hypothetical protein